MSATFPDSIEWGSPDRFAVSDGVYRITYGELRLASGRIASVLATRYGRGRYVLVNARASVDFISTLLGVMFSGNTPIPINPDLPAGDVEYLCEKSRAAAVIDPLTVESCESFSPEWQSDPNLPAMVLFTSGTSGYPKGVLISHDNLLHACRTVAGYLSYRENPSAAVVLPLHYSYGLLSQVCSQLLVGGYVRLFREFRNPLKFAEEAIAEGLQTFCGVPSTYHALTLIHNLKPLCLPAVRVLCSAGAAMDASRFELIKTIFPNARFFNNYGMTEAAPRIAFIRDDDPRFFEPTCGKPMDGVVVKVVDPETHSELPDDVVGVLVVKGPNITSGYLNDPEVTRTSFTSDGYLISGDMACLRDGYIYISGRRDDIFNVGGEKVAPLEIERVLNQLPDVELSAVAGFRDETRGMIPVAFLKLNQPLSRKELLQSLKGNLVAGKIPQRFFEVRGFPSTSNGKLQRRRLSPTDSEFIVREIL